VGYFLGRYSLGARNFLENPATSFCTNVPYSPKYPVRRWENDKLCMLTPTALKPESKHG